MDFGTTERTEAFRAEVRAFLDENITDELEERVYRGGVHHDDDFIAALIERGWGTAKWPEEWGGEPRSTTELRVLEEEFLYADAPNYARGTTTLVSYAIMRAGGEALQHEILPRALKGEIIMVLGFSEPEAGSDVANAQTRAVRDGDEWVINGSKMFTTNAHIADYVFLLTRTNPDVPKHQGLTTFLVPLDQPGVEFQAVYTLSGERTNITFYNDVRVSDRYRIGDVDGGWRVMTRALQDEHGAGFGGRILRLADEAEAWARETLGDDERPRIEEPDVRERLARIATEAEVAVLLERRSTWMSENGMVPEAEGPMSKLFSSEALERGTQDFCELMGRDGLRSFLDPSAPRRGRIEHMARLALGTTIYGGTSEVQRNIIAGRGLGLPRS